MYATTMHVCIESMASTRTPRNPRFWGWVPSQTWSSISRWTSLTLLTTCLKQSGKWKRTDTSGSAAVVCRRTDTSGSVAVICRRLASMACRGKVRGKRKKIRVVPGPCFGQTNRAAAAAVVAPDPAAAAPDPTADRSRPLARTLKLTKMAPSISPTA